MRGAARNTLLFWVVVAAALTLVSAVAVIDEPYTGPHAWVSAHFSVMARSFADAGPAALGPVPIQNNPPLGESPDAYIHWPPLFPWLLAAVFRIAGESEAAARGFVLVILAANCVALFLLLRSRLSLVSALFGVFAYLVTPIVLRYGGLVLHLHLAIFWMLLALGAFSRATAAPSIRRSWAILGLVAMVLAILTSWEPILACVGLVAAGLVTRQRHVTRLALWYGAAAVGTAVAVLVVYAIAYPSLLDTLWHVVLFRVGAVSTHDPAAEPLRPSLVAVAAAYWWRLGYIGPFGTIAAASVLVAAWFLRRTLAGHPATVMLFGLFAPPFIWFLVLWGHAYPHDYQTLLAVPFAVACMAVCVRWLAAAIAGFRASRRMQRVVAISLFVILPFVMLRPLAITAKDRITDGERDTSLVRHAIMIRANTETGAVVMSPHKNRIVTYYSGRRILHAVENDADVAEVLSKFAGLFPERPPLYVAVEPVAARDFAATIAEHTVVTKAGRLVLIRIDPDAIP